MVVAYLATPRSRERPARDSKSKKKKMNRKYIGVDINENYIAEAKTKLLTSEAKERGQK